MWAAVNWKDYTLLDCSDGERLEQWGKYTLIRPDPQVIWKNEKKHPLWAGADAVYHRSRAGGGGWSSKKLPEMWKIGYEPLGLTFGIRAMGFKHTGLFPEQAVNWDWFTGLIRRACAEGKKPRVLNLFAYTGGATVACAKAGAEVCHVDASRGMVSCAKENAAFCGLEQAPIRYIVDDCNKFVEREIRRGSRYDAVIMDPPSYGRGPNGEMWKLEESIDALVKLTAGVLRKNPLFFLINSYTTGLSPSAMGYILQNVMLGTFGGSVTADEIGLPARQTGFVLPCGSSARWQQ